MNFLQFAARLLYSISSDRRQVTYFGRLVLLSLSAILPHVSRAVGTLLLAISYVRTDGRGVGPQEMRRPHSDNTKPRGNPQGA